MKRPVQPSALLKSGSAEKKNSGSKPSRAELNNSFGDHTPNMLDQQQNRPNKVPFYNFEPPQVEEPICVLKIELDGEHVEEIKVYENDEPYEIVQRFGKEFNLSDKAKQRLLE